MTTTIWLRSLMMRDPGRWTSRLGALVSWMKMIGRGQRRRLGRAAAGVLAGASGIALMALLAGPMAPPAHAASINVDATCSLVDAIKSANADTAVGTCEAGSGADTIVLSADVILTSGSYDYFDSPTALPPITSTISIESSTGNNFTIARSDVATDRFRIFYVDPTGNLSLKNVTISNGYAYSLKVDYGVGYGGAIGAKGFVTLDGVTLEGNRAYAGGGAVMVYRGEITVTNSTITGNESVDSTGGGLRVDAGKATIDNTVFSNNKSSANGGAIRGVNDELYNASYITITNSVIDGNQTTGDSGGGIAQQLGRLVMTDTLVVNNSAYGYGGGIFVSEADFEIFGSTFAGNDSGENGGGIAFQYNSYGFIGNSSISNNTAGSDGGGIHMDSSGVVLGYSTVFSNHAGSDGGGLYINTPYIGVGIFGSLISGNSSEESSDEIVQSSASYTGNLFAVNSVFGHAGIDQSEAIASYHDILAGNFIATSDGNNVALSGILDTTLADNGGPALPGGYKMLTHNLVEGSPAIDLGPAETCEITIDQIGNTRPYGAGCDAGAVEYGIGGGDTAAFISTWTPGTIISGNETLTYNQLDILAWDGEAWTKWFDGIAAGLNPDAYKPSSRWKHNINAMSISDTESVQVFMSFTQNDEPVPGIPGRVDGMDVVLWDAEAGEEGEWELILNGNLKNIGLNNKTQEKIDGLHVMAEAPEWSEFAENDCEAYMLISTQGPGLVPKPGNIKPKNVLKFGGEDVLGFCATNLGANTTGFWELVLDGSAQGVTRNNIDSISLSDENESVLYLTSPKSFRVDSAFGGHSMVYAFDMESGTFDGPYLRFLDDFGINPKVDALHVVGELELP